jgi:hypothetical protein
VPHNCGVASGSFMAIDSKEEKVYFAQDFEPPSTWPEIASWPDEIRELMTSAFNEEQ